ncbi:MAG: SDR family NAD(P)-dependent oxidoreductase [Lachnotalea sp.]
MGEMMRIAIVTGASSGIGEEFVKQIAQFSNIDEIWVIARRKTNLEILSSTLKKNIRIISMDLCVQDNLDKLKKNMFQEMPDIKLLVNCAGYGIRKKFVEGTYEEELGMIDINCKSLTAITYICLPYMHKNSRIIQMASAAAFLPQAGFAIYSASKSYVLSFSRALNKELKNKCIYVTAVCPGPVDTEFFAISDSGRTMPLYKQIFLAKVDQVVKKALRDSYNKKNISVYGFYIKILRVITRFI